MEETRGTISSVLAEAMEEQNISIEKLSEETGISERFIELLLSEKFDDMPPAPYTHGYLIKISSILGLDGEELWGTYLKNKQEIKKSGEFDKLPENRFAVSGFNKKVLVIGLIFLVIAGYFIFRSVFSANITNELHLANLDENPTISTSSEFRIEGNINSEYQLTINESPVYPESSGNFEKVLNLEEGLNTIVFHIKGLLGKEGKVVKQIFYRPNDGASSADFNTNSFSTSTPIQQ